jgi:ubiquinone biosynthesis protein UbiJ
MEMVVWNAILSVVTAIMGIFGFFIKDKLDQVKNVGEDIRRVERLLNITREEIARDYATNAEVQRITDHIDQRFNRLEAKIDQLIAGK